jgi:hypothetical protein
VKKPKRPRVPEKSVESEIRTILELNGWSVHKIDVMRGVRVVYKHKGKESERRSTEGTAGQADLIAVRPAPRLAVCYIEAKAKDGKIRTMQPAWQAVKRKDGFVVIVIPPGVEDGAEECWRQMRAAGIEPMRMIGDEG